MSYNVTWKVKKRKMKMHWRKMQQNSISQIILSSVNAAVNSALGTSNCIAEAKWCFSWLWSDVRIMHTCQSSLEILDCRQRKSANVYFNTEKLSWLADVLCNPNSLLKNNYISSHGSSFQKLHVQIKKIKGISFFFPYLL